jgi:outer membrane protein assembly factor BamB
MQNSINASNIENGKIEWAFSELAEHPLPKSHFLGAPFPYQNKLYVLNESNKGELRLVVMTPATGKIEAKYDLEIVAPFESYVFNQRRRMYTAKFAVHDGLLYCFPQASKVFCFDVAAKRVKWSMTYQMNPPLQGNLGNWKAPTAFVQDGKLVFTVSDDDYVFCTNAKDGKLLWKVASVGDLYLAGIAGDKVLLVGHNRCRALNLKDGKEAWRLQTGTPSGIGAFDNGTYLLPLKKGKDSNQPEIAYIDVNQGALVGLSPLKDAPGNLVVHGKLVLSQSATTVTGYSR